MNAVLLHLYCRIIDNGFYPGLHKIHYGYLAENVVVVLVVLVVFRAVKQTLSGSGRECLYADGGILDQYPIYMFDGTIVLMSD